LADGEAGWSEEFGRAAVLGTVAGWLAAFAATGNGIRPVTAAIARIFCARDLDE
jgi:hypothetical protein